MRRHAGSFTIRRNEIKSAATEGGLSIKTGKTVHMFASVPEDGAKWICDRLKGEYGLDSDPSVEVGAAFACWQANDRLPNPLFRNAGFDSPFPAPATLIQAFQRGDLPSVQEDLLRASGDDRYMQRFFALYQTQSGGTRKRLLAAFRAMPESVRRHVATYLAMRAKGATSRLAKPIVAIVASVIASAVIALLDLPPAYALIAFTLAGFTAFIAALILLTRFQQRGYARLLDSFQRGARQD